MRTPPLFKEKVYAGGRVCHWRGCEARYFSKQLYCVVHRRKRWRSIYRDNPEVQERVIKNSAEWRERNRERKNKIALESYHRNKDKPENKMRRHRRTKP